MRTEDPASPRSRPDGGPERRKSGERRSGRERREATKAVSGEPGRRAPFDRRGFDRRSESRPPLLADLSLPDLDALLSYFQTVECAPGTVVVREGAADSSLYLVRSGQFEVLVTAGGEKQRAGILVKGDVFGEISFFDGEPRSAEIRALGAGEVMLLSPSAFDLLRAADPQLAIEFLLKVGRVTSARFRAHNRRLASLGLIAPALPW